MFESLTPGAPIEWTTPTGQIRTGVIWSAAPKPRHQDRRYHWVEIRSGDAAWVIPDVRGTEDPAAEYVRWVKPQDKPFIRPPYQTEEDQRRGWVCNEGSY